MNRITSALPPSVKAPLTEIRKRLRVLYYYGTARFCPICENSSSRFLPYGHPPREDRRCPHCGSLERHRFIWLYLNRKTDLFDGRPGKTVLHVAPERFFEPRFRKRIKGNYITADLMNPFAQVKMDITDIQYPDNTFDVIYCSHVLEHVPEDRKAIREFYRVLKNTGWAIILVPVFPGVTFEDPTITDPQQRFEAYGQSDHVRRYGEDFVDRLRESGFQVEVTKVDDLLDQASIVRMALERSVGEIYFCTKRD